MHGRARCLLPYLGHYIADVRNAPPRWWIRSSCWVTGVNIISFHFISFHFISFHFISFHFISFHFFASVTHGHATQNALLALCETKSSRKNIYNFNQFHEVPCKETKPCQGPHSPHRLQVCAPWTPRSFVEECGLKTRTTSWRQWRAEQQPCKREPVGHKSKYGKFIVGRLAPKHTCLRSCSHGSVAICVNLSHA